MKHTMKSMREVIEELKNDGYTNQFIMKDGKLSIPDNQKEYQPNDISIDEEYRFEGASNPDDLAILYALNTTDGNKGIITNGYGPAASIEVNEFIQESASNA